jgi:hypothetical protein
MHGHLSTEIQSSLGDISVVKHDLSIFCASVESYILLNL